VSGTCQKKGHCTFFKDALKIWKKGRKIDPSAKIFIILGQYTDLRKALLRRGIILIKIKSIKGWVENPDMHSVYFDFKWTLKAKDVNYDRLETNQIVNHFRKNTEITTKVGLCYNLQNLIFNNDINIDKFYPITFDLIDNHIQDFVLLFKCFQVTYKINSDSIG
jgi:hypothetical protein